MSGRLTLIAGWFVFMSSATFWLPGYNGTTGGEGVPLTTLYALLALAAAAGVRERARSAGEALVAALPQVVLLGLVGVASLIQSSERGAERGEPIYLYFGVALLSSWAALVVATAIVSKSSWRRAAGIGLGLAVAVCGWFLITARFD